MACVYIPVQNSEEEVRVALDMLPRDAADILDILKAEQAPLDLWLIIAVSSLTFYFNFPQIHSNFSLVLAIVVILFIYLILLMMMHCRGSTSNKEKLNNSVKFWRKVQALVILSPTPWCLLGYFLYYLIWSYNDNRNCFCAEIDEYYSDVRYERIAILNALGAYYSYLGKIETKQREKEEHFILATQYYNKASRIDMHEPSTWVGKGQVFDTYIHTSCWYSTLQLKQILLTCLLYGHLYYILVATIYKIFITICEM